MTVEYLKKADKTSASGEDDVRATVETVLAEPPRASSCFSTSARESTSSPFNFFSMSCETEGTRAAHALISAVEREEEEK